LCYNTVAEHLRKLLQENVGRKRLRHVEGALHCAQEICAAHRLDFQPVRIAVLAHDLFRHHPQEWLLQQAKAYAYQPNEVERQNPKLLHGPIAALFLESRFGNMPHLQEICEAVRYHTSGWDFTSYVGKVLFVADGIEMGREYPEVERLRELARVDLDHCFLETVKQQIHFATRKHYFLLPGSVYAWNGALRVWMQKEEKK